MSKIWEREAQADVAYNSVSDYKSAMYQLVTQQVLYLTDNLQSRAYHLICRHRGAFESVAADIGLILHIDETYRYVCVRPEDGLRHAALTKSETLFLIVLAKLYDERANNGERSDDGSAQVSIEDFKSAYRGTVGAEYAGRAGDVTDLLKMAKRFGIARKQDDTEDPDQPFAIRILPAISHLIPFATAGRLGADYQREGDSEDEGEQEADAPASSEESGQ